MKALIFSNNVQAFSWPSSAGNWSKSGDWQRFIFILLWFTLFISGISFELAKAGATVYATGRAPSSRDNVTGAGTLDDLVSEAKAVGGTVIPVFCDHTNDEQIKKLFEQIKAEQNGRLDVLVNNAVANVVVSYFQSVLNSPHFSMESKTWARSFTSFRTSLDIRGMYSTTVVFGTTSYVQPLRLVWWFHASLDSSSPLDLLGPLNTCSLCCMEFKRKPTIEWWPTWLLSCKTPAFMPSTCIQGQ